MKEYNTYNKNKQSSLKILNLERQISETDLKDYTSYKHQSNKTTNKSNNDSNKNDSFKSLANEEVDPINSISNNNQYIKTHNEYTYNEEDLPYYGNIKYKSSIFKDRASENKRSKLLKPSIVSSIKANEEVNKESKKECKDEGNQNETIDKKKSKNNNNMVINLPNINLTFQKYNNKFCKPNLNTTNYLNNSNSIMNSTNKADYKNDKLNETYISNLSQNNNPSNSADTKYNQTFKTYNSRDSSLDSNNTILLGLNTEIETQQNFNKTCKSQISKMNKTFQMAKKKIPELNSKEDPDIKEMRKEVLLSKDKNYFFIQDEHHKAKAKVIVADNRNNKFRNLDFLDNINENIVFRCKKIIIERTRTDKQKMDLNERQIIKLDKQDNKMNKLRHEGVLRLLDDTCNQKNKVMSHLKKI